MTNPTLLAAISADIPVLLWGAPGTGKTSAVLALAQARGAHCEVLIGSTLDPSDIARPVVRKGEVELSIAPWARRLAQAIKQRKPAWLFLDELSCAPPAVQAALLRVVQERSVADLSLKGVCMIAAANSADQAADHYDLSAATANRWCHLNWDTDVDTWVSGELSGWGTPAAALADARAKVTGYISANRSALLTVPETGVAARGWPSPRSWSNVVRVLSERACVDGLVGPAAAKEFFAWVAANDLPHPADLLAGRAKLPDRGDRMRAALLSCLSYAVSSPEHIPALWELCVAQRKDVGVSVIRLAVRTAQSANIELEMTPALEKAISWIRT